MQYIKGLLYQLKTIIEIKSIRRKEKKPTQIKKGILAGKKDM